MNVDTILSNLSWGMEMLPFPTLLLYVIALGMLWLLVESLATRTARAMPGWNKPFPVLPLVSEVAIWLTRGSSWLLWLWAALYFMLIAVHWAGSVGGPNLTGISEALLDVASVWQQGYSLIVGILPPAVAQTLPGI